LFSDCRFFKNCDYNSLKLILWKKLKRLMMQLMIKNDVRNIKNMDDTLGFQELKDFHGITELRR